MNLSQHRLQRLLDDGEALGHDQHPQQGRPRVPVLGLRARPRQRFLQQSRDLLRRTARQQHRHRLRNRERFAARRWRMRAQAGEDRPDPASAARVVETRYHQFAFEPGREFLVGVAELSERAFEDIHRVHPPEQSRIGLGDLERDLGSLTSAGDQLQSLFQQHARRLAPGGRLRVCRLPQHPGALPRWRRLGQRPAQQVGCGLRRAAIHCRTRGLPQSRHHPVIAGRPHPGQVRGDLPRRGSIGVQQPGRAAMGLVTLAAAQRRFKRGPDDRVNEPRPVPCCQHLGPHQALGQPRSGSQLRTRDLRRVAQLAAITRHRDAPAPGQAPQRPVRPPGR